jgi:transaldolase
MLMPVFEASGKRYGYICAQVDPRLSHDTEAMVAQAVELNAASPNIMIKMPGTAEGIKGVQQLAARGVPTNLTLAYTVSQLIALAEAAEAGKKEAEANGVDLSAWRSCATMMLGRFEDHPAFKEQAAAAGVELSETDLRWAGVAVFKKAYQIYKQRGYSTKLLAASMRVGPKEDGKTRIWHLEKFAGGDVVLTIFPNIIEEFILAYRGEEICNHIDEPVPAEVIEKLRRVPYFRQAYDEDGQSPAEYAAYPPLVATADGFVKAMTEFEALVVGAVEKVRA